MEPSNNPQTESATTTTEKGASTEKSTYKIFDYLKKNISIAFTCISAWAITELAMMSETMSITSFRRQHETNKAIFAVTICAAISSMLKPERRNRQKEHLKMTVRQGCCEEHFMTTWEKTSPLAFVALMIRR